MSAVVQIEVDEALRQIVTRVLVVARLGEVDHHGWWGTRSFGPAGRVVLRQRLSRTWRMAAVELDIASAANRQNEVISRRNAVHLFSDNWPVRRWASAWVAEQKTEQPPDPFFEFLEDASTDELAERLRNGSGQLDPVSGQAQRTGEVSGTDLDEPESLQPHVARLAAVYGTLGADLTVPYLEVDE